MVVDINLYILYAKRLKRIQPWLLGECKKRAVISAYENPLLISCACASAFVFYTAKPAACFVINCRHNRQCCTANSANQFPLPLIHVKGAPCSASVGYVKGRINFTMNPGLRQILYLTNGYNLSTVKL